MKIQFECTCGENVSGSTRGIEGEVSTQLRCEDCGEIYAVTITPLGVQDN